MVDSIEGVAEGAARFDGVAAIGFINRQVNARFDDRWFDIVVVERRNFRFIAADVGFVDERAEKASSTRGSHRVRWRSPQGEVADIERQFTTGIANRDLRSSDKVTPSPAGVRDDHARRAGRTVVDDVERVAEGAARFDRIAAVGLVDGQINARTERIGHGIGVVREVSLFGALTVAVLISVPVASASTVAMIVTNTVSPGCRVPKSAVTMPLLCCTPTPARLVEPETNVAKSGSTSSKVVFAAAEGP